MVPISITRHPGELVNPLILVLIICQLLASASVISEDVYRRLVNPDAWQARLVALAPWASIGNGNTCKGCS